MLEESLNFTLLMSVFFWESIFWWMFEKRPKMSYERGGIFLRGVENVESREYFDFYKETMFTVYC